VQFSAVSNLSYCVGGGGAEAGVQLGMAVWVEAQGQPQQEAVSAVQDGVALLGTLHICLGTGCSIAREPLSVMCLCHRTEAMVLTELLQHIWFVTLACWSS